MNDGSASGVLERAHDAAARGRWQEAFNLFVGADESGVLGVADLPVFAGVAYGAGHLDVTIEETRHNIVAPRRLKLPETLVTLRVRYGA